MRQRIGIYLVVVALVLTWPLHIGAASYLLTELVGDFFAPRKDHVLLWFPIAAAGCVLLILLVVGIFMRRRLALYASVVVLLGGLWTLSWFSLHSSYDWVFEIALAMLLLVSAFYLWWTARYTRRIPNENRVA